MALFRMPERPQLFWLSSSSFRSAWEGNEAKNFLKTSLTPLMRWTLLETCCRDRPTWGQLFPMMPWKLNHPQLFIVAAVVVAHSCGLPKRILYSIPGTMDSFLSFFFFAFKRILSIRWTEGSRQDSQECFLSVSLLKRLQFMEIFDFLGMKTPVHLCVLCW